MRYIMECLRKIGGKDMKKFTSVFLAVLLCLGCALPGVSEATKASEWFVSDVSGSLLDAIKPEAKDDFHAHVNYDWINNAVIKDGEDTVSAFTALDDEVKADIKALLQDETQPSHEAELARNFYAIAQDMDRRNELGMTPAEKDYSAIASIETLDDLTAYLGSDAYPFYNPLASAYVTADFADSTKNTVMISPPSLSRRDSAEYAGEMTDQGKRYDEANRDSSLRRCTKSSRVTRKAANASSTR